MATIRVYQTIENETWKLTFVNDPEKLTDTDKKLMRMYGEPEIELGGDFLASTGNAYSLPTQKAKVRSDFPLNRYFDSKSPPFDTNTQAKVMAYRDEIITRLTDAFDELRNHSDTFTGEKLYEV